MGDFMKKSTKNFLIGAGITAFAAGVAAAYVISVKKLVEIALDREIPLATERGKKLISGSDKLSEIAEKLNNTPLRYDRNFLNKYSKAFTKNLSPDESKTLQRSLVF